VFLNFFSNQPGGQTPQTIFTQNGLIDVDSRRDVPFAEKFETFQTPDPRLLNWGKRDDFWAENFGQKSPIIKFSSLNDPFLIVIAAP